MIDAAAPFAEFATTETRPLTRTQKVVSKRLAHSLTTISHFNADGSQLVFKSYFHIGIAIDVPGGLVVAVVRDCDAKSLATIAEEIRSFFALPREKGLPYQAMTGAAFR